MAGFLCIILTAQKLNALQHYVVDGVVDEGVKNYLALTLALDYAEVFKKPQLVRNRRLIDVQNAR